MERQQWLQVCKPFIEPTVETSEMELGTGVPLTQVVSRQVWEEAGCPGKRARHCVSQSVTLPSDDHDPKSKPVSYVKPE